MAGNIGDLQVNLSANTSPMERDVSAALKRLESKGFNFGAGINAKAFTQPLGRITGASNEFQKSLDASNARVIAFGASAGAIYSVQKAFVSLISSTIEVQKSLTDINVILGASQKTLGQFGDSLFKIAKDSGQAFSTVATAAGELARQGLSVEQTLKRTSDALVLARLSGLDAASSVEALTASINSFNSSALDSTQIVNKLAAVDSAFAVSSGDLAEALKRVGSSAQDVGVTFDELLAIVASVNQTTARGGAVIGNSLKTIFTRVQRTDVLDQLESLGVAVRDLNGNTAPAIQVLTGLASKFDELGAAQKSQIAELVGGVFQINILKAALGDLSKQYSVYGNALKISQGATDEATRRNEELNKTLSALLNRTVANLTKVGSDIGSLSFAPAIEKVLGGINTALEAFDVKGDSIGGKIGKGIFEGIGTFVSGPGLALLIGVFLKIFGNLAKFTTDAVRTVLGLNKEAQAQAQIQERINSILSQNPQLIQNILNKQVSLLQVEKDILTVIQAQSQARAQSTAIAATLTKGLIGRGVTSEKGVITAKTKSQGFIPNFNANREIMGAISGGYMPGQVRSMNIPNYGRVTYNDAETVKQFSGLSQPGIMPPANSDAGKAYKEKFKNKYGIDPYANSGFIPNFGQIPEGMDLETAIKSGRYRRAALTSNYGKAEVEKQLGPARKVSTNSAIPIKSNFPLLALNASEGGKQGYTFKPKGGPIIDVSFPIRGFNRESTEFKLTDLKTNLDNVIDKSVSDFATSIYKSRKLTPPIDLPSTIEQARQKADGLSGSIQGTIGGIFESAFRAAFGNSVKASKAIRVDGRALPNFDVGRIPPDLGKFFTGGTPSNVPGDFKSSDSDENRRSMALKILSRTSPSLYNSLSKKTAAQGFIPNFSPLDRALSTEGKMGGKGVLDFQQGVGLYVRDGKTQPNFAAVMRDHPEGISNAVQNSKKMQSMMSAGFIPNFAGFDPMSLFFIMQSMGGYGRTAGAESELERNKLDTILKDRIAAQDLLKVEEAKQIKDQTQINYLKNEERQLLSEENKQKKLINSQMGVFGRDRGGKISGGIGGALGRFGSRYGAGIALAAPLLADTAAQFIGDEGTRGGRALKAGVSGLGSTASYAGLGFTVGGPIGAAIGGGIGGIMATYDVFQKLTDIMPDVARRLEVATEKFNNISAASQTMSVSLETLSSIENRADLSAQTRIQLRMKAEEDFAKSIAQLDQVLPGAGQQITDLYQKIGDTAELRQKITQLQTEAQKESKGLAASANLFSNNQKLNDIAGPTWFQKLTGAAANASAAEAGMPGQVGAYNETAMRAENIKNLKGAQKTEYLNQVRSGTDQLYELFANFGKNGPISSEQIGQIQAGLKDAQGLEGIKNLVESLTSNGEYADIIAENLNALVESGWADSILQSLMALQKRNEKIKKAIAFDEQAYARGGMQITDLEGYKRAFSGTSGISREALGRIDYSSLGEQANISRGQAFGENAKNQFAELMQEIGYSSENVQKFSQYNEEAANIQKDLSNKLITFSQATERLKLVFDKISFEQNAKNMFSGERASARQGILEGQLKQGKFAEGFDPLTSFFDRFGDNAATTADKINKSFANLADNLQTGFEDAFGAFINGTKTADQAFQDMLLSISQQIIKEQFSIGMRSLLGGLTGGGGFGGTSDNSGGLLGGVFNSIFGGGKAQGGIIRKYSSGGSVNGGSGVRDDVPAMLTDGEYVLRKSAVNKYGKGMLDMLNQGGMVKGYASGGSISMGLANTFDIFDPQGNLVQNPIGQYALDRTISSPEELKNIPEYTGKYNISNLLSSYGMTREDNPMNDLRSQNARSLQGYQENVSNFKTSYNEAMRQVEEQRKQAQQQADEINSQAMAQYNRSLTNTFIGGLASAGLSAFGTISSLPSSPFGTGLQTFFGGGGGGAAGAAGGTYSLAGTGGMFGGFLEKIGGALGGLFGGGGGNSYQPGAQYNDPRYQEQISKQIESAIQKQTFDRAAMGITSPYQSYGGIGGAFDGSQIPYYGSGAGRNVGLGAPAGVSTFTQNQNYVDQYLTRPAGVIPPTGLMYKSLNQDSMQLGYAKGGRVRKYKTGSEGGVRGDNLTQQEAMMLLLNQGINPYLKIKPYVGKSIYGNKKIQGNPNVTKDIESILSENPMKRSENIMDYLSREGGQGFSGKNRTELNSLFLASQMQEKFKDRIDRFTGFADEFHDDKAKREKYESYHVGGKAIDFTLKDQKEYAKIEPELMSMFQQMGLNPKFDTRENSGFYRYKLSGMDSKGNPINMGMFQYEVPAGNNTGSHLHVQLTDEGLNRLEKLRTSNQFAYTDLMPSNGDPFKTMVAEAINKPAVPVPMKPVTIAGLNLPSRSTNDLVKKPLDEKFWAGYDEYMKNMSLPKANVAGTNTPPTTVKDTYNIAKNINTMGMQDNPFANQQPASTFTNAVASAVTNATVNGQDIRPEPFIGPEQPVLYPQPFIGPMNRTNAPASSAPTIPQKNYQPFLDPSNLTKIFGFDGPNPEIKASIEEVFKMQQENLTSTNATTPYQSAGNLYEQVGLARNPLTLNPQIPSYLNKYAPFYGSGKDYYNPGGMSGFNNYMNYLGLGSGTSLSSLSSFQFPMTPTTLSPYAFSSSPFGGGAISYGAGIASAPSTYFSAGSRLGATPSWASRATGGMIYGGTSVKDDVPAMLMGGEYVIRKDAVDRFGQPFFDRLNRGQVTGFAEGGPVGTNLPSLTQNLGQNNGQNQDSQTQMTDALTKLLKSLEQLNRSVEDQTKEIQDQNQTTDNTSTTTSEGITNNISINVSVGQDGQEGKSSTDSNSEDNGKGGNDQEKLKKTLEKSRMFAELLRQQVLKTIVEEQRPGGVLYQGSKGRDMGR